MPQFMLLILSGKKALGVNSWGILAMEDFKIVNFAYRFLLSKSQIKFFNIYKMVY